MSFKILTKNSIDNTNIDGARQNHFSAGMRSGIVKGAFNEGRFFASASNVIALDSCELRISGHQIIVDSIEAITLNDRPSTPTKYSMVAEIQVDDIGVPNFRLFIQPASTNLIQENLFKTNNGKGTYQLRMGNFTLGTTGLISDVIRTADIITGGGDGGVSDIKFNATATQLSSSSQPEVNADYNEETKEWDLHFGIPAGSGSKVTIGGVEQATWSADFAESERQKSKNLLNLNATPVRTSSSSVLTYYFTEPNLVLISNDINKNAGFRIKVKPNTTYTISGNISGSSGLIKIYDIAVQNVIKELPTIPFVWTSPDNGVTEYAIVFYATNETVTYSHIQIEEGTVATDYQPYNGAIVHEKNIEDVEHRKTIYDTYHGQTIINDRDYGGGIYKGVILYYNFRTDKKYKFYVLLNGSLISSCETFIIIPSTDTQFGITQKFTNENTVFLVGRFNTNQLIIEKSGYYNVVTGSEESVENGSYSVVRIEEIDL